MMKTLIIFVSQKYTYLYQMKQYLNFLFLIISLSLTAQSAPAYYQGVNLSLEGQALKQALANHISSTHNYTVSYNQLWSILKETDENPENDSEVLLIYGWDNNNAEDDDDYSRDKDATCGNGNPCTDATWNREHVFPKGLDGSSSNNNGPTADPHHLRASDVELNGLRGNKMFGAGSGTPSYVTSQGDFFPGDNWKGDVARIIMYMYVRYGDQWNPNYVGSGSNTYHAQMPDIFLEWNAEDPVSAYETNRNNIVELEQGNRNPFIDNPFLATVIWGGPSADNTWPDTMNTVNLTMSKVQVYPNPTDKTVNVSGVSSNTIINVYNGMGQLIQTLKGQNQVSLPEKGMFILRVTEGDKVESFKVIRK